MPPNRALQSSNWRTNDPSSHLQSSVPPSKKTEYDERFPRRQNSHRGPLQRKTSQQTFPSTATTAQIYVGNLPYTASATHVLEFFASAGLTVVNVDISIDPFTNKNPSYCFVGLDSETAAACAIQELNGMEFQGRQIKIGPCFAKRGPGDRLLSKDLVATRWRQSRDIVHTNSYNANGDKDLSRSDAGKNSTTELQHYVPRSTSDLGSEIEIDAAGGKRRVFVDGLPKPMNQHTADVQIRNLFSGFAVEAVSKVKSPSEWATNIPVDKRRYYAFVDLRSAEDAEAAVKLLDGREVYAFGGRIRVSLVNRNEEKK
ncbi:hypothetical protein BCR34DRAFT_499980 [Clohesyomyces aquaticus]|uniref:RRM domain-containing protein n=1 Tax=Clohesyomyces aquaticus TaxID=1231657 RepID=A0A1Y1Y5P3_9PLEO|nr:hypothetical protein BCR34DRAFT_499980 [Clohesyomyces aquaticus]